MNTKKQNYTLPIVMMFALFAMIAFVTNLCSPMAVIVKNQFGASNFAAQLGNAANFIAYAVMGIPSGLLLEKIGYKKTALLAIVIGYYVIGNVHHALHTPLMSVTNAISGVIVVGALLQIGIDNTVGMVLAGVAILVASINVFGGFAVTRRMLGMFSKGA